MNPQQQHPDTAAALSELRQTLKDKFAGAHRNLAPRETLAYGVEWLDRAKLEKGAICEISGQQFSAGAVLIGQCLRHVLQNGEHLLLIDGADSFDPAILPLFAAAATAEHDMVESLDRSFAWARCRTVKEAVQVADLILRDGNLPRTLIDLQNNSAKEIQSIPRSSWFRLRSLVEESGTSCLILTPQPMIACAALRFELTGHYQLDDLESPEFDWLQASQGILAREHRQQPSLDTNLQIA